MKPDPNPYLHIRSWVSSIHLSSNVYAPPTVTAHTLHLKPVQLHIDIPKD